MTMVECFECGFEFDPEVHGSGVTEMCRFCYEEGWDIGAYWEDALNYSEHVADFGRYYDCEYSPCPF